MSFLFLLFLHAPTSALFQHLGTVNSPSTLCWKMMKCRAAKVMKLHWRDWENLAKMVLNQIEQSRIINTLIHIHSFIYFALFQLVQELMDSTRLQEVQERVDERRGSCWSRRWRRGTSCRRWRRGRRRCRRGMTRRRRSSSCWSRRKNQKRDKKLRHLTGCWPAAFSFSFQLEDWKRENSVLKQKDWTIIMSKRGRGPMN